MYKYCNNLLPSTLKQTFKTNSENHGYDIRFATNFDIPNNKLEFGTKSNSFEGVKIWNNISKSITNSNNIKYFKHSYKEFLICNYGR